MSSTVAELHYLLFRPLAHRNQRLLNVPSEGPMVAHLPASKRSEIIRIVNDTWDIGIEYGMRRIPRILAPGNVNYCTNITADTIRHAKDTPVDFVWLKSADVLPFRIKGAVFAVAFAIRSAPTFHLLDLSWLLLRFQDRYIREGDYNRFNL
ncbi:hypothetical protein C8F01DRAFT_1237057, partial [Mycena amicta]